MNMAWRFAEILDEMGLNQEKAAEAIGCSVGQINHLRSGKRKFHTRWVSKISETFGIPEWQLFASVDEVNPPEERAVIGAYKKLSAEEKMIVDKFLFGSSAPQSSIVLKKTSG